MGIYRNLIVICTLLSSFCWIEAKQIVSSDSCDMFTQCFLDDARLNLTVSCDVEIAGNTAPPCYGDGSKLNCSCNSENYRLSSPNDTYLCNPDKWEDGLYDLYCFRSEVTTLISTTIVDTTTITTTESTTEFPTTSIATTICMTRSNLPIAVTLIVAIFTFLCGVLP
ncbi:uncharacterized protein [Apostichopus japonicus]|uniref:uncharacterized protein n=1 Tax=Stichopus japonicus TaxID=307972 RepID=UPI003AB76AEF